MHNDADAVLPSCIEWAVDTNIMCSIIMVFVNILFITASQNGSARPPRGPVGRGGGVPAEGPGGGSPNRLCKAPERQ